MAKKRITSRPGLFGTVYYYDESGNPVGKSRPGLQKGTRIYTDRNGRYTGKSRPGFLAKEVFTDTEHNQITSYDSLLGEVHFKSGAPVGHTAPGFFDSAYTTLDEEEEFVEGTQPLGDDCEAEEAEDVTCEEYSPDVTQHTIVRNLQLFALCLVICMVLAAIYAILKFS